MEETADYMRCLSQIFSVISDMIIVPTADIIVASGAPASFPLRLTAGQVEPGAGGEVEETGQEQELATDC